MKFNLKEYRVFKVKKHFKSSNFFFIYNSAKIKLNNWILTEQNIRKLKLEYHQIFNKTSLKTINSSIYKNTNNIFSDIVIIIKPKYKSTEINKKILNQNLNPLFVLLTIKLNNKIYTPTQIKNLESFSYKNSVLSFNNCLNRYLKTSYKLTEKKSK